MTTRRDRMRRYVEETGLPFDVLIDERQDVIRAYGVWHRFGFLIRSTARPAVFLIDGDSTIRASWVATNQTQFPSREEILAAVGG